MEAHVNEIVLPGQIAKDNLLEHASNKAKIILGPGLKRQADTICISRGGRFRLTTPNRFWIESPQKKYFPTRNDSVIGVVTKKMGDYYKVDIGASEQALLHFLSFEGVSKKLRPQIEIGDAIFAKLLMACPDLEPELVCVNSEGKKEKMGILPPDGFLFSCSLHLVRKILNPNCKLLSILGQKLPFESVIGMNGKVWIKGKDVRTTIVIGNAILNAEIETAAESEANAKKIVQFLSK